MPSQNVSAPIPSPSKSIVYKTAEGGDLELHVFNPPDLQADEKRPAIALFFGGGWLGGSPSQLFPQCEYFASRGIIAISVEYRTEQSHGTSPQECVKDAKSAMRWLRANAQALQIDTERLAAGGGSAGAHIAAATATIDSYNEESDDTSISCRPDALVLFNPVIDNGPEGYGYDRTEPYWQKISPLHNIDGDEPPTLVMLGTEDDLIPVETGEAYQRRMRQFGLRCDLKLYEGQAHGFFNHRNTENFRQTLCDSDRFLASLGYLEGPPSIEPGKLLYRETFTRNELQPNGLPSEWWLEGAELGATAVVKDRALCVDATPTRKGCTVWLDRVFPRDIEVTFDAYVEAATKDANNINFLFQFRDRSGTPLRETLDERGDGKYSRYHSEDLEGIIVTYLANGNPESARLRVRQVPPFNPVLKEFNGYHARAEQTYGVRIARKGNRLIVEVDHIRLVDTELPERSSDAEGGYLGFRTWNTQLRWDNLVVRESTPDLY